MVRLPTFIDALAAYDGRTRSTIDVLSRELRSERWLAPTKRGVGASHLSAYEASNLLIACMATDSPAAGPRAVEVYRTLKKLPAPGLGAALGETVRAVAEADTFGDALDLVLERLADLPFAHLELTISRPAPYARLRSFDAFDRTHWQVEWITDPDRVAAGFYGPEQQSRAIKRTETTINQIAMIGLANLLAGQREENSR